MILDKQTLLSAAQTFTADAASTNYYDLGAAADAGPGQPIRVFANIDTAFDNLTTLAISLRTDDNASFSSETTLWTVSLALAAIDADATKIDLPAVPAGTERYLRLYYDVTGTAPTNGAITAGFILDDQKNTATTD